MPRFRWKGTLYTATDFQNTIKLMQIESNELENVERLDNGFFFYFELLQSIYLHKYNQR